MLGGKVTPAETLLAGPDSGTPNSSLQAGKWYHLTASYEAATHEVRLYVDGKEAHLDYIKYEPTPEIAPLLIGTSIDKEFFAGALDDVRIFNRVLCEEEIAVFGSAGTSGGVRVLKWIEIK